MHPSRALYVDDELTVCWDGERLTVVDTPSETTADFVTLLHRLSLSATVRGLSDMTVILDGPLLARLGFPAKPPATDKGATEHALLQGARAVGWRVTELGRWMSFRRHDTATVHIGVGPWLNKGNFVLWKENLAESVYLLGRLHQFTGTAFRITPGVTGCSLLEDGWTRKGRGNVPRWKPAWERCDPAGDHVTEQAYARTWWSAPTPSPLRYLHGFDSHRAYLGAAGVSEKLSMDALVRSPLKDFDRNSAGYWQCVVPHWNETRMPHPIGPKSAAGTTVWVTTPTLTLIEDLANQGYIEMPAILDSWVAPVIDRAKPYDRTRRILRTWAETLDKAADAALDEPRAEDAKLLEWTIKKMYKAAFGNWLDDTGRIWRPDWSHSVLAKARTNTWRKAWSVGMATGRWPETIHVDEIVYASDKADPYDDIPHNFRVTPRGERPRLGMFKEPNTTDTQGSS